MSDLEILSRKIDALHVMPANEQQRRLARLTVCEAMTRSGCTVEEIHEVLAALGLDSGVARPITGRRGSAGRDGSLPP
jgi:hypothetical protein